MVYTILVIVQVVIALVLIGLILVQHGKGADAGAAFGSGASGTVFGAKGSANFMTRATGALATVFFAISLTLAYLINGASAPTGSVTDQVQQQAPGASLLSDSNNNGVPGDEVVTGEQSAPAGDGNAQSGAAQSNAAGQDNNQRDAGGDNSAAGTQQSNGNAGSDAGDADTGVKVPE
ncbi:preprotein translocase subunit SecG [Salinisphaera aquimarina]|uniref:Protein-export membrane protein SecG n=1 Tax=Salinisphaera aquimarina TaxID=2094031 RepID=A0ABV7EW76_9GAMM